MAARWVYTFGDGTADGDASMKELLGGKGANLAEMASLGLPVPPGFTITTELCRTYLAAGRVLPAELESEVIAGIRHIEAVTGARFGDPDNTLLVSVRSGAQASMPGMMDTVLNLGLNDETVEGLARSSGDPRFAYDSYRRFIQMFGDVVLEVEHGEFEELLNLHKTEKNVTLDTALDAADWRTLAGAYKDLIEERLARAFPQDPVEQLWSAIRAVLDSWMNPRAVLYRDIHHIPEDWGTAVNVQAMIFGNMGEDCATGVAFTRDFSTGEPGPCGEYLVNAQGEDVVSGIRTPLPLADGTHDTANGSAENDDADPSLPLERAMPTVFGELVSVMKLLESHYRDAQDIEFTIEHGKLWILQTRAGKRTAKAAIKIALDMVDEGLIDQTEALRRIDPAGLNQLVHPTLDPDAPRTLFVKGLAASPGAASGAIVFTAEDAEERAAQDEAVILVRNDTAPEDIHGMHAARAVLTRRGGTTSHAALVARGWGRPCITGAELLTVNTEARTCQSAGRTLVEGDIITVDGSSGRVFVGEVPTIEPDLSGEFATLMRWADAHRRLRIRANAETPADAQTARKFGAEGIGLCRTEHMFFDRERIVTVREMILADDEDGRRAALAKLLPMQRADFIALFRIMAGLPVTVRLLDPPLHEFLPSSEDEIAEVAEAAGIPFETFRARAAQLHETNPMLGHRGCRLGISYPEIYEMQARAIFEAAATLHAEGVEGAGLEIMVPLVASGCEVAIIKEVITRVHAAIARETGAPLDHIVGTMIELPRAALRADEIAESAAFFSFGTNDLTQTTFGISRDDAGSFLGAYEKAGILATDPFASLDQSGVGELVRIACERGRATNEALKLGICGEHGGDPRSIAFFEAAGLDYVSCSPYRVPIARLAAAQAALASKS